MSIFKVLGAFYFPQSERPSLFIYFSLCKLILKKIFFLFLLFIFFYISWSFCGYFIDRSDNNTPYLVNQAQSAQVGYLSFKSPSPQFLPPTFCFFFGGGIICRLKEGERINICYLPIILFITFLFFSSPIKSYSVLIFFTPIAEIRSISTTF